MYLKWFERSACKIFLGLKVNNLCYGKFECDWPETHIDIVNNFRKQYEKAVFYNALTITNILTLESKEYFKSANQID